jgi:hypothetical protein
LRLCDSCAARISSVSRREFTNAARWRLSRNQISTSLTDVPPEDDPTAMRNSRLALMGLAMSVITLVV